MEGTSALSPKDREEIDRIDRRIALSVQMSKDAMSPVEQRNQIIASRVQGIKDAVHDWKWIALGSTTIASVAVIFFAKDPAATTAFHIEIGKVAGFFAASAIRELTPDPVRNVIEKRVNRALINAVVRRTPY